MASNQDSLTQSYLKELLDYDPDTGVFRWKPRPTARREWNSRYAGTVAGYRHPGGIYISIYKTRFLAHRLAFLYMTGEWPVDEVDHRNRNPMDNRWCNIREATRAQNARNASVSRNNVLGMKGVYEKRPGQYVASICVDRRIIRLGTFDTPEAAHRAYCVAAAKYHGEFASSG